jgi:signal transduction histidine kinase/CheY-like chemotaxis protein
MLFGLITQGRPQQLNYVLDLDGDGDCVELPSDLLNDLNEFTIEGWVKWRDTTKENRFISFGRYGKQLSVKAIGNNLFFSNTAGHLRQRDYVNEIVVPNCISTNSWHHIAVTCSTIETKIFVDGNFSGRITNNNKIQISPNNGKNILGRESIIRPPFWNFLQETKYLNGQIDDFRIWNTVRSLNQIKSNILELSELDGLVGRWTFDKQNALDDSSNNLNGILHGNPKFIPDIIKSPPDDVAMDLGTFNLGSTTNNLSHAFWRVSSGDDMNKSKIEYDDSSWGFIQPEYQSEVLSYLNQDGKGVIWFRLNLQFDDLNESQMHTFTLKHFTDNNDKRIFGHSLNHLVTDVFLNGNSIYENNTQSYTNLKQPFYGLIAPNLKQVIAIRLSLDKYSFFDTSKSLSIFRLITAPNTTEYRNKLDRTDSIFIITSMGVLFLTTGLIYFMLFICHTAEKKYLYFSMFLFFFSMLPIIGISERAFMWIGQSISVDILSSIAMPSSFIFWILLARVIVDGETGKTFWFLLVVVLVTIPLSRFAVSFEYIMPSVFSLYIVLFIIDTLRLFIKSLRLKHKGKAIALISIVFLMMYMGLFSANIIGYQLPNNLFIILFFTTNIIPIIMAFSLAKESAKNLIDLEYKLIEVEKLSEVTLKQEQEKQQLVKEQNLTLEKQVKHRTSQLEEARDASETANKAKSTFLANMSHELRTPLNAILGYSEMLQEEAEDLGHKEYLPDLSKINSSGKHLLGLINDILDLSKIESGRMTLYLEDIQLRQLVEDVSETVKPLVAKNQNILTVDLPDGNELIHADITKLRQTLFNLLSNAAKFTEKGKINLGVSIKCEEGKKQVLFAVKDEGIGLSKDQIARLFQPFSQADESTTRKYGGTGLGLAISRKFCQLMGGELTVQSEPGKGSVFTAALPVRVKNQAVWDHPQNGGIEGNFADVLVIDDDAHVRDLIKRNLSKERVQVAVAMSGDQGIEMARKLKPSVITLDIMMPNRDGWSVLNELKADPELRDIPIVLVTMVDDRETGFALGAADYIVKPINWENLTSIVKRFAEEITDHTVLVIEDDSKTREIMNRTMVKAGWKVSEASNGKDALVKLERGLPGLVLLDLMMPEMDGFEFMHEFRSRPDAADIPVIVVTAKDLTDSDREALSGKVTQILQKGSYRTEELIGEVKRFLPV